MDLPEALTVVAAGSGGSVAVLADGGVEEPQPVVRAETPYDSGPSATCSRDSSGTGAAAAAGGDARPRAGV